MIVTKKKACTKKTEKNLNEYIKSEKVKVLRKYQKEIISWLHSLYDENRAHKCVVAVAPGGGKTFISTKFIENLLEANPNTRILVLPHSTNILKHNFVEEVMKSDLLKDKISTDINNRIDPSKQIQVFLPQSTKILSMIESHGGFDLIIVDEAHQNYLTQEKDDVPGMIKRIVDAAKPRLELLLTGTPSKFLADNSKNGSNFLVRAVGMDQILEEAPNAFHNLDFTLVQSDYDFQNDDYNVDWNLKEIEFDEKRLEQTKSTVRNVVYAIVKKLVGDRLDEISDDDFRFAAREYFNHDRFGKTIFMCKRIEQANKVAEELLDLGIRCQVSNSQNDKDSNHLMNFKNSDEVRNLIEKGLDNTQIRVIFENAVDTDFIEKVRVKEEPRVLIVVARAREGYSDDYVTNVVDLTMTHNIDLIYQMFARAVRHFEDFEQNKLFIKVTPSTKKFPEFTAYIMCGALMLTHTKYLGIFNGKNFSSLPVPKLVVTTGKKGQTKVTVENEKDKEMPLELKEDIITTLLKDFTQKIIEGQEVYKQTNIHDVIQELKGLPNNSKQLHIDTCIENSLISSPKFEDFREKNPELRLNSQPWKICGYEKDGEFYSYIRKQLGIKDGFDVQSIEECVEIAKKNGIKTPGEWRSKFSEMTNEVGLTLQLPSAPWNTFKLEGGEKEFGRLIGSYKGKTLEDYVEIGKANSIKNSNEWKERIKELKQKHGNLPKTPWTKFKIEAAQFSALLGHVETTYDYTLEDYIKIAEKHSVNSSVAWTEKYKDIEAKENMLLPSTPWTQLGITAADFGKALGNRKYEYDVTSIEECVILAKKHGVRNSGEWSKDKGYITIGKAENIKLPANPWDLFKLKGGSRKFTELINDGEKYLSYEQHIEFCLNKRIYEYVDYKSSIKSNNETNKDKLKTQPWVSEGKTQKCFFDHLKDILGIRDMNEDEYYKHCIDNKLTNIDPFSMWRTEFINQNPNINVVTQPWKNFGLSQTDFFDKIRKQIGDKHYSYEKHIEYCAENQVFTENKLREHRKQNKMLKSAPWYLQKETTEDFFQKVIERSKRQRTKPALSEFSKMNKDWSGKNSSEMFKRIQENPEYWQEYHKEYSRIREDWEEIPFVEFSKLLSEVPEWIVGDFGCGTNELVKRVTNTVYGIDMFIEKNNHITNLIKVNCDMSNVPLKERTLDVAIFSLSLMGTNYVQYIKEAARLLKPLGHIWIAEPISKWQDKEEKLSQELKECGFEIYKSEHRTRFIYFSAIKKI